MRDRTTSGNPRILYFDATAGYRAAEGWGISLVNDTVARTRGIIDCEMAGEVHHHPGAPFSEGPYFSYDSAPRIFLGRRGSGALFVVWDTNLLVDYFNFGADLWQSRELPTSIDEDYQSELEGLQLLLALSVLRDLRFIILPQTVRDSKKLLSQERRSERLKAFREFVSALSLVDGTDELEPFLILPEHLLDEAADQLPAGYDRWLVRTAASQGVHVFLTRDSGILRQREAFKHFGLLLMSPMDLVEELVGCGAYHCIFDPEGYLHWPMADQQRVAHLIHALPSFPDDPQPLSNPAWIG